MKTLENEIKGIRTLVFLDLEGTQFSHEMIEIGAYRVSLRDDLTIKKVHRPFKSYVKAKHGIGRVVTKLTGITEETLQKKGVPFRVVQQELKRYLGRDWSKCLFVTFGSHDLRIIMQSALSNLDSNADAAHYVVKHDFDLQDFIARYVKDDNGNPLSLTNYLKVYHIPFEGQAHDAETDAYNLMLLYKAFIANPAINEMEYKKTLSRLHHLPIPVQHILSKLTNGNSITPKDWDDEVKESFK